MSSELDRSFERAKKSLLKLERTDVVRAVGAARITGTPRNAEDAVKLFDSLRCELFVRVEMPGEGEGQTASRSDARVRSVLDELAALARLVDAYDGSLLPRIDRQWVLAQRLLLDREYEAAFEALMAAVARDTTRKRVEELAAKPAWKFVERHEAKVIADCTTDLLRALREVRPPSGSLLSSRVQVADACGNFVIERLSAHQDLSRWSARRLLSRAAFELADRGERPRAASMLALAGDALESWEARTRLAQVDELLILYELEVLRDEPDLARAQALWDGAIERLRVLGFVRRKRELERMKSRIAGHSRRSPRRLRAVKSPVPADPGGGAPQPDGPGGRAP